MADLDIDDIKKKKVNVSIENLIMMGAGIVSLVGMWYALQGDIEEAKKLPEPEVSRTEYDLKDQLIRENIINTNKKVEEIDETVKNIDEKLFEIIKK
jgi:Flp pilus assembly protein TadD|tara:strand:+ start:25 stop:315 length:291 start_codon:yes stop_codon:yes gene_type:complete